MRVKYLLAVLTPLRVLARNEFRLWTASRLIPI